MAARAPISKFTMKSVADHLFCTLTGKTLSRTCHRHDFERLGRFRAYARCHVWRFYQRTDRRSSLSPMVHRIGLCHFHHWLCHSSGSNQYCHDIRRPGLRRLRYWHAVHGCAPLPQRTGSLESPRCPRLTTATWDYPGYHDIFLDRLRNCLYRRYWRWTVRSGVETSTGATMLTGTYFGYRYFVLALLATLAHVER